MSWPAREVADEYTWLQAADAAASIVARCALGVLTDPLVESPIEKIFGVSVLLLYPGVKLCQQDDPRPPDRAVLIPQYRWRNYRMDWALCVPGKDKPVVFVECDGAEFHSTVEQQARDRRKDDEARDAGIQLLRFSGSDIYRNYDACAKLTMDLLGRSA